MSSHSEQSSSFVRFFDALFQEQNIKWLLGLGCLILLSSSTMLVLGNWDSYTPLWKYAVFIGYTSLFYVAGQFSYHQLALRKTGNGLMALTVLLIPLSFSVFRWINPASLHSIDGVFSQAALLVLLTINLGFACFASKRIFKHFFLRTQPTFQACYLTLAVSGAIVPVLPASLAPFLALISWGLFAVASAKINRHAFWLAEEYRKPRIFGFFPILLLGIQFLTLCATFLVPSVSSEWIGLGLVATAIPILLAADSLARVIQVRSRLETPPFPASVVVSMISGVTLVIGGVFLSAYRFPETIALVPTSLSAAIMMGLLAHRTAKKAFVWIMMLLAVAVYQSTPVFFKEILVRLANQGASVIGEDKLPIAFYGLTYLPLLAFTSFLGEWLNSREKTFFARPLKQFSVTVTCLLVPLSFSHEKALLPVGICLGALLTFQTFWFRDRRLLLLALGSFLAAALGLVPFLRSVFHETPGPELFVACWIAVGGFLLFPGRLFDLAAKQLPPKGFQGTQTNLFSVASLMTSIACTISWSLLSFSGAINVTPGIVCLGMLTCHAILFRNTFVSSIALTFPIVVLLRVTANLGWSISIQVLLCAISMAGLSICGLLMSRSPRWIVSVVFKRAAEIVSGCGLIVLQLILIPVLMYSMLNGYEFDLWGAAIVSFIAGADLTWRSRSSGLVVISWISLLALSGCAFTQFFPTGSLVFSIPASWASLTVLIAAMRRSLFLAQYESDAATQRFQTTIESCLAITLGLIAIGSLPFFSIPARVAGTVAILGGFVVVRRRSPVIYKDALLSILNLHFLTLVIQACCPEVATIFRVTIANVPATSLPLAFAAVLSAMYWRFRPTRASEICGLAAIGLELICGLNLLQALVFMDHSLGFLQITLAVASFAGLIANQSLLAIRKSTSPDTAEYDETRKRTIELHVWLAQALTLGGIAYFVLLGVIPLKSTLVLFTPLLLSAVCWTFANSFRSPRIWNVFQRPLGTTAFVLPTFTVLIGVMQHISSANIFWPGLNSLALFLAGGFYFWRGLEERRAGLLLGSAVTLNVSLVMLWNDLHWSDPQLFLIPVGISVLAFVELLRTQIPVRLLNPLRYAGALCILVSPTFEIVGGSWIHLLTLMMTSVVVVVVAMGIRVKALMYTGTAFLMADLLTIVVRGTIDQPSLLWLAGIAVGAGVIGLAAYCERHREKMLQQIRFLAAELETWN